MIRVGVVGATGYAGAELVRILQGHPEAELSVITSRQYAGTAFSDIYPALYGIADMLCESFRTEDICEKADIIFTALPHKLPMEIVPELLKKGKRVVDLSADFRFRDVKRYESAYQPHCAKELSEKAAYGLSEIYREEIQSADIIGNPGCYPTSVLLPLIPLIRENLIDTETIICDSKSGVSGAGRSPSVTSLYSEVAESFKPYKVAAHRHNPEMDEVLSRESGKEVSITFVPHLLPMSRGMLTTGYANLARTAKEAEIRECLQHFYQGRQFVRILPEGKIPNTLHVRSSNFCDIGCKIHGKRLILVSAIDNLVKGAAGQAVQNMNIMCGLDESSGLDWVPCPL